MKTLNSGIKKILYGSSDFHSLLCCPVGINGENITIMVLSCNRSSATIKLLQSIIDKLDSFKGNILIIDNNSNEKELKKINNFINKYMTKFNVELIQFQENKGVAGGRNAGVEYVKTEWVLSLDNDIYFINNPFEKISFSLSTLGCHFLNLSLLNENGTAYFADGGHLYIDNNLIIGGGSLYKQEKIDNNDLFEMSMSTFLFGGASVFNVATFKKLGKYDENYFIGFEDTDFSIKLFRSGYKIGNCHTNSLIHDHKFPVNNLDSEYEKIRFSSDTIKNSALYFEKKWGFKVWNPTVEMWLFEKQKELGIIKNNTKFMYNPNSKKKKIALVVDVKGWAFWNIASQIKKNESEYYDFDIIVMEEINDIYKLMIMLKIYDHVHFFWRGHLSWIETKESEVFVKQYGFDYDYFYKSFVEDRKNNMTTSVYDHLFINKEEISFTNSMLSKVCGYTVSSEKLKRIYQSLDLIISPASVITDGVDLSVFKPERLERFVNRKKNKLIIGWVGNSLWQGNGTDTKGVNTILKPAINELKNDGYNIEEFFADKQVRFIPHDDMPEYYSKIDVLICTSLTEGTPNPVLEAMACGVPIISTDVGIVPEVFGKKQKEFILNERSINDLKDKIKYLYSHQEKLDILSKENMESIKKWDWKIKTHQFKVFFDNFIDHFDNHGG